MIKHPVSDFANTSIARLSAIALAASGFLFILYPAIRPFSDEASLAGAAAFGSDRWVLSHILAILAFVFMTAALLGMYVCLQGTNVERLMLRSVVLSWLGVGLTLPYYGAEVFGIYAIGQKALTEQNTDLVSLANEIRFGPGFPLILTGLLLLAIASVMVAAAVWKSRIMPKWSGIPFAFGFLLYLPQYLGSQPIRVIHGLVITVGCLWIAAGLLRRRNNRENDSRLTMKGTRLGAFRCLEQLLITITEM